MSIQSVKAREILDSRGNPTIEVEVWTNEGMFSAKVPSGASTGIHEAYELRDGDKSRYFGFGVLKAVCNVNNLISPILKGMRVDNQKAIDDKMIELDGTKNKSKLGANAIVGVSMAVARAAASIKGIPLYRYISELAGNSNIRLPVPCFNVINGGKHAGNRLPFQEFMLVPHGAPNFKEALRYGSEVYHSLKEIIKERYGIDATNVGDEGGFAPSLSSPDEALTLLVDAINHSGYEGVIKIAVDSAASEFWNPKDSQSYDLDFKNTSSSHSINSLNNGEQLLSKYVEILKKYPIAFFEDPFGEDDWENHSKITAEIGMKIQIIGDDLLCTNPERIKKAIAEKTVNSLLLKINQIGTLTETIEAAKLAKDAGWGCLVSHRSGETDDHFIADLVVGLGTGEIKSGAPCRFERLAKYNRLMKIEEELEKAHRANGNLFEFAGDDFYHF
ncbi:hypothetical protein RB653_007466 [Dictyostelium firmibasis]|uniref:phosphopyruvate hydratase n=1 Tax=Dictyostelium firmibasis TaxID=79012 RepID=A0AAN7TWJ2_9MYCE